MLNQSIIDSNKLHHCRLLKQRDALRAEAQQCAEKYGPDNYRTKRAIVRLLETIDQMVVVDQCIWKLSSLGA